MASAPAEINARTTSPARGSVRPAPSSSPAPRTAVRPEARPTRSRRAAGAAVAGILQQALGLDRVQDGQSADAGHRPSAERRGVLAGPEGELLAGDGGPDRQAAPEPLGQRDHVRARRRGLEREPFAAPADPGLDLVEDQERAPSVHRAGPPRQDGVEREDPALAEDGLQQDRRGRAPHRGVRAAMSFGGTWTNPSGSGANGACFAGCPVAARVANVRPWNEPSRATTSRRPAGAPVLAGDLQRRLVGLGPGVGEEHLPEPGQVREPVRQLLLLPRRVQVGDVDERAGLLLDGLEPGGVRVAEGHGRDPGREVQVGPSLGVPDAAALAADQGEWIARVRRHDAGVGPGRRYRVGPAHASPSAATASATGAWRDHGAQALGREQLQDQRVLHPAVDEVGPVDPGPHGVDGALQLGDHAAVGGAADQLRLRAVDAGLGHQLAVGVQDPLDVREVDQLLRAEGAATAPATRSALTL